MDAPHGVPSGRDTVTRHGLGGAGESIYWANFTSDAIRVGNLDGSGEASNLFTGENLPIGIAIDPVANKIYWANVFTIRVGNLDDSESASDLFTEEIGSFGIAIDPDANKIYWADEPSDAIRVGNLDGSGKASNLFTGESSPLGVTIDPDANKIYWANATSDTIRVGNLDGSGTAEDLFTGESSPRGVAIDPEANKIYWANFVSDTIRVGNLDGSGAEDLFTGESGPMGVAIDPEANKIYWALETSGAIRVGNLDGSGAAQTLFENESEPTFLALLRAPSGIGAPEISGGGQVGDELTCDQGSWAPDLPGGFLFRAPSDFAYQWRLDGEDVPGADQPTFIPTEPGVYTCRVTASNHAGSTAQTSAPHQVDPLPPVCEDVSTSTPFEQPVEVTLDCSGQGSLIHEIVSAPANGVISNFDADAGTLTYTPDPGFSGADTFTYRASNAGGSSAPATVSIAVSSETEVFTAMALAVDPEPLMDLSDGNDVFEPGERVVVAPAWRNDGVLAQDLNGDAFDFTGPAGPSYTVIDGSAFYGTVEPLAIADCLDLEDCYALEITPAGAPRPAPHWDATFDEELSDDTTKTWTLHIGDSFLDVPRTSLFYPAIETLLHSGVSSAPQLARRDLLVMGCGEGRFCPTQLHTRAQAAVFLLKAVEGPDFVPPPCEQDEERFGDVPFDSPFCPWIEELARREVTAGCRDGDDYCPTASVTRSQMAVLLLKAREGTGYEPPECTGEISDVPCASPFADWIEELLARGVTAGCTTDPLRYCPTAPVARQQMAVFVTRAFELALYGRATTNAKEGGM